MESYRKINPDDLLKQSQKPTCQSTSPPPPPSIVQAKNFTNNLKKNAYELKGQNGQLSNVDRQNISDNTKIESKRLVQFTQDKKNIATNGDDITKKLPDKHYSFVEDVEGSPHVCPPRKNQTNSNTNLPDENAKNNFEEKETKSDNKSSMVPTRKISKEPHWRIMDPSYKKHKGGCHCGAVRFEVYGPESPTVIDCNCSICVKKQNRHFIVPEVQFKLLKGHDSLTTYSFNTHKAKHTFCSICGVQSFYIPRSNSDGYGIVIHCLDEGTIKKEKYEKFDGQNWEIEIEKKSHIKKQSKIY